MKIILIGLVVFVSVILGSMLDIKLAPSEKVIGLLGKVGLMEVPLPEPTNEYLTSQVIPQGGYTVNVKWGDTGLKLIESGAIDLAKYKQNYGSVEYEELLSYLTEPKDGGITITENNAYFWVNTLWALGLAQKSTVLEEGIMGTEYEDELGSFASTGGWTLGAKPAVELFSSSEIVALTDEQQLQVDKISQGVYRPCCGNPTSFPDCNHGMAILGLIELMVSQGFSEDEVYQASLAFNSYWFPTTYIDLAYYFQTEDEIAWKDVSAKKVLSAEFSSAQGYQAIKRQIGNIPGSAPKGGSCGA